LLACFHTQLRHVSDRDAAVFREHKRLSFSGEAGHFIDDRFFLTAIQTQGLLLQMRKSGRAPHARSCCSDQLFWKFIHLQRDRHLRWQKDLSDPITPTVLDGLAWRFSQTPSPAHHPRPVQAPV